MATIYNSDLSKEMIDGGKIQTSRDRIPTELAEKVLPVMEVNPKLLRRINIIRAFSASATIYTTPTDRDFLLVGLQMSAATADDASLTTNTITITPKGSAAVIALSLKLSTPAIGNDSGNMVVMFPIPMLLERGTNIISARASDEISGTIFGYIIDNSSA